MATWPIPPPSTRRSRPGARATSLLWAAAKRLIDRLDRCRTRHRPRTAAPQATPVDKAPLLPRPYELRGREETDCARHRQRPAAPEGGRSCRGRCRPVAHLVAAPKRPLRDERDGDRGPLARLTANVAGGAAAGSQDGHASTGRDGREGVTRRDGRRRTRFRRPIC